MSFLYIAMHSSEGIKFKFVNWNIILIESVVVVDQLLSCVWLFVTQCTVAFPISLLPYSSPSPEACLNSCPLSQWYHPTISSSVTPFSSCPQSFPASGTFPMNWLFASSGQSIGASASASVLPMKIQGWFPLWLTGLISLLECPPVFKPLDLEFSACKRRSTYTKK